MGNAVLNDSTPIGLVVRIMWFRTQPRCSNGCSLDVNSAFSYRQSSSWGSACVLSSNTRLLDLSLPLSGPTLSSPEGTEFGYEGEKSQQDPHNYSASAPQTQVCVCVRGQGIMFAFPPGVGTLPPCLLSPEARALSGTRWASREGVREGGE